MLSILFSFIISISAFANQDGPTVNPLIPWKELFDKATPINVSKLRLPLFIERYRGTSDQSAPTASLYLAYEKEVLKASLETRNCGRPCIEYYQAAWNKCKAKPETYTNCPYILEKGPANLNLEYFLNRNPLEKVDFESNGDLTVTRNWGTSAVTRQTLRIYGDFLIARLELKHSSDKDFKTTGYMFLDKVKDIVEVNSK